MLPPTLAPALAFTAVSGLSPFSPHDQITVGPYSHETQLQPVPITDIQPRMMGGLEVRARYTNDEGLGLDDELFQSGLALMRLELTPENTVAIDQLRIETGLASLKIRRNLGDYLDLAILGGDWDKTVAEYDTESIWLRAYSPSNLTLLGFSNTDQDDDDKLKYYISIGSGVGGELMAQIAGPLGVYAQGEASARTMNRHRADMENFVRHEVGTNFALGLIGCGENLGVSLTGWGEMVSQWETRDADGKSGVDRQQYVWGVRLGITGGSSWTAPPESSEPESDILLQ